MTATTNVAPIEDQPIREIVEFFKPYGTTVRGSVQNALNERALTFAQVQRINERLHGEFGLSPIPVTDPEAPPALTYSAQQLAYVHGHLVGTREAFEEFFEVHQTVDQILRRREDPLYVALTERFENALLCAARAAIITLRDTGAIIDEVEQASYVAKAVIELMAEPDSWPLDRLFEAFTTEDCEIFAAAAAATEVTYVVASPTGGVPTAVELAEANEPGSAA